jgi:hypothetical protein
MTNGTAKADKSKPSERSAQMRWLLCMVARGDAGIYLLSLRGWYHAKSHSSIFN